MVQYPSLKDIEPPKGPGQIGLTLFPFLGGRELVVPPSLGQFFKNSRTTKRFNFKLFHCALLLLRHIFSKFQGHMTPSAVSALFLRSAPLKNRYFLIFINFFTTNLAWKSWKHVSNTLKYLPIRNWWRGNCLLANINFKSVPNFV